MRHLGYKSSEADPDLWTKVCTRDNSNGPNFCHTYVLIYLDDILYINDDIDLILAKLDLYFPLKPDSAGEPNVYLEANLK